MRQVTTDHLATLLATQEPPCISLYQRTHRHHPDNEQDPIRYRNSLKELEDELRSKWPTREIRASLRSFQELARDDRFWNHRTDGLAILSSPTTFQLFELQRAVPNRVVVAGAFHTKPLLRILQSADRFQVLCLNRHEARLYEGNRDVLDPVDLAEVPATITQALGEELTSPHLTVASYGKGSGGPHSAHGEPAMHHGHGSRKEEIDLDRDRFFRVIDRGILEHHSRPSGLPLMLAALPEYHAPFREVSRNPFLVREGIMMHADALSADELRRAAWKIMEPQYLQRLAELVESYHAGRVRQLASDDLSEVAQAAAAGKVGTLLVDADREVPGRLELSTGQIEPGDMNHPEIGDVLDDVAKAVLRRKGTVVVVPAERMPSKTGLAATYRY